MLGTACFLAGDDAGAPRKCLGRLAPLGRASYGLYLYHWPLLVFLRIAKRYDLWPVAVAAAVRLPRV